MVTISLTQSFNAIDSLYFLGFYYRCLIQTESLVFIIVGAEDKTMTTILVGRDTVRVHSEQVQDCTNGIPSPFFENLIHPLLTPLDPLLYPLKKISTCEGVFFTPPAPEKEIPQYLYSAPCEEWKGKINQNSPWP